jgi:hypothetical protein
MSGGYPGAETVVIDKEGNDGTTSYRLQSTRLLFVEFFNFTSSQSTIAIIRAIVKVFS